MTTRGRDGAGEAPYAGTLGATRREPVFLTGVDGGARRVDLVRVVNTATDPDLAEAARAGSLHHVDGIDLAVPFVYHDPAARHFILVVPAARAHEELALRAELLTRLAADAAAALPAYVREARAVIGPEGLARHLAERALRHEATDADVRLEAVALREERLRKRAEEVLQREDELLHQFEELEVQKADLQVREAELEQRFGDLLSREEALADEERALRANKNALQTRERLLATREEALDARERALDAREAEIEAREAQHLETAAALAARGEGGARAQEHDALEAEPIEAVESEGEIEQADSVDDVTPLPSLSSPETLEAEELEQFDDLEPGAPAVGVPATWQARGQDAYAAVVDGEVRLWARGGPEDAARLAQGSATLVLQADPDSPLPLAVLAIPGERALRAVLDLTRPDDRAVLETLARDFRVRLEVINAAGRILGSHAVAAPGEANAQRVLAVLTTRAPGSDEARRTEAERLAREGVRSSEGDAFERDFDDESSLATAAGAARAVQAYLPLLDPATLERLVLARGVPAARLDAVGKRVILAALRCGVELPPALVKRAIELGIAPDEKTLATRALTAFARSCESGLDAIGRTPAEASRAWGPLLAWAAAVGAAVPDAARAAMRALFDPDDPAAVEPPDPRPAPTREALATMRDEELATWADHPDAREAVAREMAARDPARFAEPLARALRRVEPEAAADLAARMIRAGDALGDVWVELLGSRRPLAAAVAAVATGVVRLRRGLNPVVQRALAKDNDDWQLFAWAAGQFGASTVRALGGTDGLDPDRLAWVLAHAVRTGGGREVERVRTSSKGVLAEAATRAVGRVDEARAFENALRRGPGATDAERIAHAVLARVEGAGREASPSEGA
jgi:hypothetical protein